MIMGVGVLSFIILTAFSGGVAIGREYEKGKQSTNS